MGFFNKKKQSEKVYLDNSPEAVEAREFMASLKQTKEFKTHEKLEKKALKTKDSIDAERLKKTAENCEDPIDAKKNQEIADKDTYTEKSTSDKSKKGQVFFKKLWNK